LLPERKRPEDANGFVAAARQLTVGNQYASAVVDLFCASSLLEQRNLEQGLHSLGSMLTQYGDWLRTAQGRAMYDFIQVQWAFSLVHLGKNIEARRSILEQVAQFELDAKVRSDVHCHLGRCYHELSLYGLVREQFEQANALGINEEWRPAFHY
jgi:hypothetical protein